MFENLDDPLPPAPAPVDAVTARGLMLQIRRRAIAGFAVMVVLAGTIATAAALQDGTAKKVVVSNESTTTSATTDTTTDTTAKPPASTTTSIVQPPVASLTSVPAPTTTGTTQPPHDPHDYSQLAARWPTDSSSTGTLCPSNAPCDSVFGISTATTRQLSYVVYNLGAWAVDLPVCVTPDVNELWAVPAVGVWAPYSKGIWPQPYPARDPVVTHQPCTTQQVKVGPNESITLTTLAVGGYRNAAGDVMPSPPGFTSFQPSYMPQCAQPCATPPNGSLKITVHPGQDPKKNFQVVVKSMHPTAASGGSAPVEITYTNPLGFTVRMPLFGPCWTVKSGPGTADCSRPRASVIVEPHGTVDLVGTIWARNGFTATGAPLAPGKYRIDLGDLEGSQYPFSANYPYLTVTP